MISTNDPGGKIMASLLSFGCEAIVSAPALALVVASVAGSIAVFFTKK